MAKKNLLKANLKRPSLKREMKVTEEKMDEVVQKVADNPPPVKAKAMGAKPKAGPSTAATTSTTPPRQASETTAASATTPSSPQPKRGRGRPKKEAAVAKSPRSVHPKEGSKRLTLDIPQSLHKQLKLLAIHQEISMKDYIIQVVERSLR